LFLVFAVLITKNGENPAVKTPFGVLIAEKLFGLDS
jgi:hypothetical protein